MNASPASRLGALALLALSGCARASDGPRGPSGPSGRVSFATERVSVGDETLAPMVVTVERDRGAEQSWYLAQRPSQRGDLRVRVAVEGASFEQQRRDGLLFAANGARVLYSHGTWVDADGVRTPVPARFVGGAIELVVRESVLERSRFPAVLDPDIVPLNGDARLDGTTGVDVAYPVFARGSEAASIALAVDRGPLNPTVRVLSVDRARRASAFERTYFSQDAVGLSSVAMPAETFVLATRAALMGGAWGNLLLTWYPASAPAAALGFAANDLPEFSCGATGVCAFSYARMEVPSFAVRRVTLGPAMGALIASSGSAVIGVGEAPSLGEHDVAVLGETVVAASSRVDINTMSSLTEIARIPLSTGAGTYSDRLLTAARATRPRLACSAAQCAVVVATAASALAIARFGAGTVAGPLTVSTFTLHAFTESIVTHDVAVIDGGYRVAYIVRDASRLRLMVADLLASDTTPASLNEYVLPMVAARNVRIASAPNSRVSLVTWVQNVASAATAHGALVLETPDASTPDASMPDGATLEDAAIVDVVDPADGEAPPDASAQDALFVDANDAASSDGATGDASASDATMADARAQSPMAPQYGGGACACAVTPTRGSGANPRWAAAWIASMALAFWRRKR